VTFRRSFARGAALFYAHEIKEHIGKTLSRGPAKLAALAGLSPSIPAAEPG
jgi:hypothetical protein